MLTFANIFGTPPQNNADVDPCASENTEPDRDLCLICSPTDDPQDHSGVSQYITSQKPVFGGEATEYTLACGHVVITW